MYWMKFEDFPGLSGLSLNPESPHMMTEKNRERKLPLDCCDFFHFGEMEQWEKCPA